MDLLLDTHALLWWLAGDSAFFATAKAAIADETNPVFISAASTLEITTKHRLGRLPEIAAILADLDGAILEQGILALPITIRPGQAAGAWPGLTAIHSTGC